jgi:hypothetical protein
MEGFRYCRPSDHDVRLQTHIYHSQRYLSSATTVDSNDNTVKWSRYFHIKIDMRRDFINGFLSFRGRSKMNSRWPTLEVLVLPNGTFERKWKKERGRTRIFYRCWYLGGLGPNHGKQCEFEARNGSPFFNTAYQGRHEHRFSIAHFADCPPGRSAPTHMIPRYCRFVCQTNLS